MQRYCARLVWLYVGVSLFMLQMRASVQCRGRERGVSIVHGWDWLVHYDHCMQWSVEVLSRVSLSPNRSGTNACATVESGNFDQTSPFQGPTVLCDL